MSVKIYSGNKTAYQIADKTKSLYAQTNLPGKCTHDNCDISASSGGSSNKWLYDHCGNLSGVIVATLQNLT
ncbi:MAG: hypothetical protein ACFCBW_11385, partial [Candidatus Competibacterales bacterium]